jgi:hypothetical protein
MLPMTAIPDNVEPPDHPLPALTTRAAAQASQAPSVITTPQA